MKAVSRWHTLTLVLASLAVAWIVDRHNAEYAVVAMPLVGLATGLFLKLAQAKNIGGMPRAHMVRSFHNHSSSPPRPTR